MRFGAAWATGVLPAAQLVCTPICSSQGKAMVTPSPLRTVRRLRVWSGRMAGLTSS